MRFEARETIGVVENPNPEDIRRGFLDDEWGDVGGNVSTLRADDGVWLAAISGDHYRDFGLSIRKPDGKWWRTAEPFTVEEIMDRFIRFSAGDREWFHQLMLEPAPDGLLGKLAKLLGFRQGQHKQPTEPST